MSRHQTHKETNKPFNSNTIYNNLLATIINIVYFESKKSFKILKYVYKIKKSL